MFATPKQHPILFEECFKNLKYVAPPPKKDPLSEELGLESMYENYYRGCHLFVLVHGF